MKWSSINNDFELIARLKLIKENGKMISYHKACYSNYSRYLRVIQEVRDLSNYQKRVHFKNQAFQNICDIVDTEILESKKIKYFNDLRKMYKKFIIEKYEMEKISIPKQLKNKLESNLKKIYKNKIRISQMNGKKVIASRQNPEVDSKFNKLQKI